MLENEGDTIMTDVYLVWDDMTRNEKERQLEAKSLSAGHLGYLRASLYMTQEQLVFEDLFPPPCWRPTSDKGEPFNFVRHQGKAEDLIKAYLATKMSREGREKVLDAVESVAKQVGPGVRVIRNPPSEELRYVWAQSLRDFVGLGVRLQKQGKNPKVYISW